MTHFHVVSCYENGGTVNEEVSLTDAHQFCCEHAMFMYAAEMIEEGAVFVSDEFPNLVLHSSSPEKSTLTLTLTKCECTDGEREAERKEREAIQRQTAQLN